MSRESHQQLDTCTQEHDTLILDSEAMRMEYSVPGNRTMVLEHQFQVMLGTVWKAFENQASTRSK